ncbi:MAG: sugar phosphate isomerase/epimerase, partial [Gammaproteobacteria bacterium]
MSQRLEVFQSMWSMEQHRPDGFEWGHEEKFAMMAEAGYDGVGIDFAWSDINDARQHLPMMKKYNLACALIAFPTTAADLKGVIDLAGEFDTRYIAVNARYFPWTPAEAVGRVEAWLEMGDKAGIPVYLETHRLTVTNDVVFTLDLMDLIPEMEMVADLSHIVVAREFPVPVDALHNGWVERILQRSASMQGRISSREQVQIPLGFPQHEYW